MENISFGKIKRIIQFIKCFKTLFLNKILKTKTQKCEVKKMVIISKEKG